MGRTDDRRRSQRHLTAVLNSLPAQFAAHGEIVRVDVLDPEVQVLVEFVVRSQDGTIKWLRI
jgi:hypothetical protein